MKQFTLLFPCALLLLAQALFGPAHAQSAPVQTEIITKGLEHPWGLDFLPDGAAVITERPGRIRIWSEGRLSEPVKNTPAVFAEGQGGMLDVVASPDFARDNLIFFSYSEPGPGGGGTAVARGRLTRPMSGPPLLENVQTIFSMKKKSNSSHHFGSRLAFASDGSLFITTGDRGDGDRAQDWMDSAGAVLRILPDGAIPPDNPGSARPDILPELWSKGHRNIQGAAIDPQTGKLWTVEHGAMGGDEINQPEAGKNYGWPHISWGRHYSGDKIGVGVAADGYEQPTHYWDPSIAPSGMAIYDGAMFQEWKGDLLVGSLKFGYLARLRRDASGAIRNEEKLLENEHGRIRDVNIAPDGSIWLLNDEEEGAVIRLSRANQ